MLYNFKKNIIKNNNSYSLNIKIPKKFQNINYKIYNNKFLLQSGHIVNSNVINQINVFLEKLDTIFILINTNNSEYFELVNLKNLYTKIIENIKINFKKNEIKTDNNFLKEFNIFEEEIDEDDEDDEDDDEDDEDDDEDDKDNENEDEDENEDENEDEDEDEDEDEEKNKENNN